MKPFSRACERRFFTAALALGCLIPSAALALPPAPANDDPAFAEPLGPALPTLVYGSSVLADDSITSIPALPDISAFVDGPDVYYSFTPTDTATYRVQFWPWQKAPLRSSDRRFVLYVFYEGQEERMFVAGVRAPGDARPVNLDVALEAGTEYFIGVDHDNTAHDNFDFTLIFDQLDLTNPDTCATVEDLSGPLPILRLNDIDPAAHDYNFVQGDGRCGVSGTPTTAPGNDHVYSFTPAASGDYAIELVVNGFDGVLYVNDSCPPVFPEGCLGASNHSTSGTSGAKHELVVVTLEAGVPYYIFVDNGSTSAITGPYALVIDDDFEYEMNEIEPNDNAVTAAPLGTPLNGGQLVGPLDQDWWAVEGLAGDRVYAWVNNGGSSNSTLDTDLAFYAADGTTLIEFDDEDADGADAPIEDLRFIYSTSAPVIAGAQLTSDGTHYFVVTDNSDTGTVHRYRFHTGVIPGSWSPTQEIEPNDDLASADVSGKNYFTGAIVSTTDADFFAFEAVAGDRVFIAFDGDPERDSTGFDAANEDPNAFHGKLVIYDPDGDVLISDISDSNSVQEPPDYPAQGGFFVARTTGTHYVEVGPQSTSSQTGPTETYDLAIFIDEATPDLAEGTDPIVVLTPDFVTDVIMAEATDADSGICAVELLNNLNLQITNLDPLPGSPITFDIELVNPLESGSAKLLVTDCAGNTALHLVKIDIAAPVCDGFNYAGRTINYLGDPLFIPDNDAAGIQVPLNIPDMGLVTEVTLTITAETTSVSDLDIFLISPSSTSVEVQTDRGSSSAFNMIDATWDDDAEELMPILSGDEPYTGTWLPEGTLATFDGEQAQGDWVLQIADDSSSQNGGSRLVYWTLNVEGTFPGPEIFSGLATDEGGLDAGIASIVLTDAVNVTLTLPDDFAPGDLAVPYTVSLIDTSQNGSGTITVTDLQENVCISPIALNGLADNDGPANTGGVTTDLTFRTEVQADLPSGDGVGHTSTLIVMDDFIVNEVEAEITIDTNDLGRLAATLTKDTEFASLINRVGMDERQSVGLTKNTIWVELDDDAPVEDDAHLEPALGTIPFLGLHQPDGRGEFVGDGITTDLRDNMLLNLGGLNAFGGWKLQAADYRLIGSTRSEFRRWSVTLKSPCGPERYVGTATDILPGTGLASIALAGGATNLELITDFEVGAEKATYRVELIDPTLAGSGTVEIEDLAGNGTMVPIDLMPQSADQLAPQIIGAINPLTDEYQGTATDDVGVASVELLPYGYNLQLVSVTPDPPGGAASVDFVVGLVDPLANGRGYLRVTDTCGWRSHRLVELDVLDPVCTGQIERSKRYISTDLPQPLPDNDPAGVVSSITVPDTDTIEDVNITVNITHAFDDDIDTTLISPQVVGLFNDIGSTGNDFIDTTIDDEAAEQMPDSAAAAPFTGSWQPLGGPALFALDGVSAAQTYILRVADDKTNDTGTFDSWAITIASSTFPLRYDGRAEDSETFDTGICLIDLAPGAFNLTLVVDPFTPGDKIVRYSVELTNSNLSGGGTVQVFDCAGNLCEVEVSLIGALGLGDMNCDGFVDFGDINPFVLALSNPAAYAAAYPECDINLGDINQDGFVNFRDINPFVVLLAQP